MLPVRALVTPSQGGGVNPRNRWFVHLAKATNVSAVIKKPNRQDISDYDIHIQFVDTRS